MKRTLIAGAVALGLGLPLGAQALTVNMTQMHFGDSYNVTGTLNSAPGGSFSSLTPFFGVHWTADGQAFFDATGPNTWAGSNTQGAFSYNFSLTSNQVAWGLGFNWNNYSSETPVLNIMTCTGFTPGNTCTGTGTPMQTPPFAGQAPAFDGMVASPSMAVPLPAAAWLMASGLVGLGALGRRKARRLGQPPGRPPFGHLAVTARQLYLTGPPDVG